MYGSMVDIQSATAENRPGKKEERKKVESFPFRMSPTVNRDNREVVLSNFTLCACGCEFELQSAVPSQ